MLNQTVVSYYSKIYLYYRKDTWTYRRLQEEVGRLAGLLNKLGVEKEIITFIPVNHSL